MGTELTQRAIQALRVKPEQIHSFGKAAIVGTEGEFEHAAAILHPQLGQFMRKVLNAGKAVIRSAKKVAAVGLKSVVSLPVFLFARQIITRPRAFQHFSPVPFSRLPAPFQISLPSGI